MKLRLAALAALVVPLVMSSHARAESADPAIVTAAGMMALGRLPTAVEAQAVPANATLASAVTALRDRIRGDEGLRHAVFVAAFRDTFGRNPSAAEETSAPKCDSYVAFMREELRALAGTADAYDAVLRLAYPFVIHREIYPEEIAYWKKQGVIPYALLVGCIEGWARRNQPGLMVTAGKPTISVNSEFLTAVQLSPSLAAPAREFVGLPAPALGASDANRRLIAVGGEKIATEGGMYLVVAGRL